VQEAIREVIAVGFCGIEEVVWRKVMKEAIWK
jgi:hypothetical protein